MGAIATRLAALAARAEARSPIPADIFGAALLTWGEHSELPTDRELANAILDQEEAFVLAAPQSLDAELLAAIDLVRTVWTDDARKALRRITRDLGRSRLRQARLAVPGRTGPC